VVEILSKSTSVVDRGRKFHSYAEHGVREYWLVDQNLLTVEVYYPMESSGGKKFQLHKQYIYNEQEDVEFTTSLYDDLTIKLKKVFFDL
jgi:Uma2 family endonuclease